MQICILPNIPERKIDSGYRYFATALAKQYGMVYPYLAEYRLEQWVHNKAIQKAVESLRVTPAHKENLKNFGYTKTEEYNGIVVAKLPE